MASSISRKLDSLRRAGGVGVPSMPPSVGALNLGYGQPPRIAPEGEALPNVQPEPITTMAAPVQARPEEHPVMDAVSRALMGFQTGAASTPDAAKYNPVLGGIVGGLSGLGAQFREDQAKKQALEALAAKPYNDAFSARMKTTEEERAKYPFAQASATNTLNRELQVAERKAQLQGELMKQAKQESGLPASVAESLYFKSRAVIQRRNTLSGASIEEGSPEYEAMVNAEFRSAADAMKKIGTRGIVIPPAPPSAPQQPAGRKQLGAIFGSLGK